MKKDDPIGNWLGRRLERLVGVSLGRTPQETAETREMMDQTDPLRRLGISNKAPEVWKSLLWWGILVVGMVLAWYMSFHRN
jgi:hypothetical protein